MRIAYLTTDEVNRELVARMAAECGAVACALEPKDPAPDGRYDAVLHNLDDLTREERAALLEGLGRGQADHPTAVHGYVLTAEQARALDRQGVAAARRLHPGLIRGLVAAARTGREAVSSDDAATDLTWVNLVG
jgi:hypothetical protein